MSGKSQTLPARGPGRPAGARSGAARESLIDAAHQVMAEQGYPRVTLRQVADRAGVQPALVSYYFGSKQGLLRAVIERVSQQMHGTLHAAASSDQPADQAIRSLTHAVLEALMAAPYGPRLMVEQVLFGDEEVVDDYVDSFARPNLEDIRALLREGEARGELRPVEVKFLTPVLMGACAFFFLGMPIHRRLFGFDQVDSALAAEFADFVSDVLLRGIAAQREGDS